MSTVTKKAVIVDTFNNYQMRTRYVKKCLEEVGYQTTILASNFSHINKSYIKNSDIKDLVLIDTLPYTKNLSFKRIKSHVTFSKTVYKHIDKIKPDLIYCILPPNSLAKYITKFGKKNKCRVFFDVFDLWPESLPASSILKKFLFPWKNLRNSNVANAEKVFTECHLYKKYIPKNVKAETLYLSKEKQETEFNVNTNELNFLYIGSINNIIDIDGMVLLLSKIAIQRKVNLHVIGGGENENKLFDNLSSVGVNIINHGKIYDEQIKTQIVSQCHFGLNMYKKGLCIGLTMKSMDYFSRGLPVITSNIYDTAQIVKDYDCGIALDNTNDENVCNRIVKMTDEEWLTMNKNTIKAYDDLFSPDVACEKLRKTFIEDTF